MLDCFSPKGEEACLSSLLRDILSQGDCPISFYYTSCSSYGPGCRCGPTNSTSLCSLTTLNLLKSDECARSLKVLPKFVQELMLGNRRGPGLIGKTCGIGNGTIFGSGGYFEWQLENRDVRGPRSRQGRLNPVWEVNLADGYKTRSDYINTRHRYPWLCSLRHREGARDYLCAVTLLGAPPGPTVIVSAAHCTFMCRGRGGRKLPSCCCRSPEYGPSSCSGDVEKCTSAPGVVEMGPGDAEVLCGEWETGNFSMEESGERYNLVLPITQIIRHPGFIPALGPIGGNDLAVFKVDDTLLKKHQSEYQIYPACLPPLPAQKTPSSLPKFPNVDTTYEAIHSGWSNPPPIHYLQSYGQGYLDPSIYRDFSKQWHRKMDVFYQCNDDLYEFGLNDPNNPQNVSSFYPSGTMCARDFTERSCFSPGDSGSTLMLQAAPSSPASPQNPLSVVGIASFVKGCDWFRITNNAPQSWILEARNFKPLVFTKLTCFLPWVAQQYGLSYPQVPDSSCDQEVGKRVPVGTCLSGCLGDLPCIFPFYYNGRLYNECILLELADFVHRVRCPTRNITRKINGINAFNSADGNRGLCGYYDSTIKELDPDAECPDSERGFVLEQCRLTCPGSKSWSVSRFNLVFSQHQRIWSGWRRLPDPLHNGYSGPWLPPSSTDRTR